MLTGLGAICTVSGHLSTARHSHLAAGEIIGIYYSISHLLQRVAVRLLGDFRNVKAEERGQEIKTAGSEDQENVFALLGTNPGPCVYERHYKTAAMDLTRPTLSRVEERQQHARQAFKV